MRKIISIILISLLALGLVACGDSSQNKIPDESTTVEKSNKGTEETNKENLHGNNIFIMEQGKNIEAL